MQAGGNAVDAALAAAITLTVVEPCSNGVGGDAFAMVWDGNQLHGLNASGRSPQSWCPQEFQQYSVMPDRGWKSVTVPGAVSAWVELSDRFGRLSFSDLFESAIHYAEHGFHVGRRTAYHWNRAAGTLGKFEAFREHFLPSGRAPSVGERFLRPDLATTLRAIAFTKGGDFYSGKLAELISKQSLEEGGLLSIKDLQDHQAEWCEPISLGYGSITAHEIPPNGQGLAALIALGILDRLNSRHFEPGSPEWTHLQVEAMKIAIVASFQHISEPQSMETTCEELLDSSLLDRAADSISDRAAETTHYPLPNAGSDTVYLCTADNFGNLVSYIQSNYMGFGSGIVIKGTGIALQNRGAGFTLEPGHPNEVGPSKRPFHTIIPGFVSANGSPQMAFGVMGGHMQHQGHVQMISRVFDHGQNPQAASDAPRWYVSPNYDVVLEKGFATSTIENLRNRGHSVRVSASRDLFGGAQLIACLKDGYCAASDHRKEGQAAGY